MAHTSSKQRQPETPSEPSVAVMDAPEKKGPNRTMVMEDPLPAKIAEMRLETLAKMEIEQEAAQLRRARKAAQQESRDTREAALDAERMEKKKDEWQGMIRSMNQKEFKRFTERIDYIPAEMDDMIRDRQGFATVSKAVGKSKTADLVAELKRRGIPISEDILNSIAEQPQAGGSSTDPWSPEENAVSPE